MTGTAHVRLKHRELSQSHLGQWGYDKEKERDKHIQGNIEASCKLRPLTLDMQACLNLKNRSHLDSGFFC